MESVLNIGPAIGSGFKRKKKQRPGFVTNLDDVEGNLINVGVIAALVLSFGIGLYNSISKEDFASGTFNRCMVVSHQFRTIVINQVKTYDPSFNFTFVLDAQTKINITSTLMMYPSYGHIRDVPNHVSRIILPASQLLQEKIPFAAITNFFMLMHPDSAKMCTELEFTIYSASALSAMALSATAFSSLL